MHRFTGVATCLITLLAVPTMAQEGFNELAITPGDVIYVTDSAGITVSGPLKTISPSNLTIDGHEFKPAAGLTIERRGDSVRNGTLIGLAFGAGLGAMVAGLGECPERSCRGPAIITPAVVYAVVGAVIDWRHKGRTLIYRGRPDAVSLRIAPELTPSRRALGVVMTF